MADTTSAPYLRTVDPAAEELPPTERFVQRLLDRDSGATSCMISWIRTPPEGGSPAGMHTHEVDQHIYVLRGTMSFEAGGERFEGGPGSLVFFPAGTPHRNWNAGAEPTVHLAINSPLPEPGKPLGRPVS
ncbi:MAG TPA: cupin domain-containing protein [Actinomycetes bacterium]|nr:cupin domain-containing protein [Actinomycetes bacterium]